ncbi:hypothetical protein [Pseudomonas tohonis]|uniref:hypothetical protein n=1 Tax=Pseudomonas tohonis TaxID=2725477 RepID=UPI00255B9588|nr:hypothetical protein [Pseudomonas tohonis]
MRLIFALLILFSSSVFAEDYYWFGNGGDSKSPTPAAACVAAYGRVIDNVTSTYTFDSVRIVSDTGAWCYHYITNGAGVTQPPNWYGYTVSRGGSGCTLPSTYDDSTKSCTVPAQSGASCGPVDETGYPRITNLSGECVQALRADIASFCKFHGSDDGYKDSTLKDVLVQKDPNGNPIQPTDTAQFGCSVKVTGANCTTPPPSEACTDGVCVVKERSAVCTLNVQFTGQVFNDKADPGVLSNARCKSGDCLPPEPKQEKNSKPCTYVSTGQNSVACVSSEFFAKDGQSQCGTVNGVLTCKNDMPKPVSGGIRISTDVTSEPQPDGTTKITKTDKRTDTKCVGMSLVGCISGVTTSTTVTIKDGNGNVVSQNGNCTGKLCPDSNTNPDADGDGFGDCASGNCSEGDGEGGDVSMPELGEVDGYKETAGKFFDRVSDSPLIKSVSGMSFAENNTCPVYSAEVTYLGVLDTSFFCQLAPALLNALRYLLLATYAWAAVRVFMMA